MATVVLGPRVWRAASKLTRTEYRAFIRAVVTLRLATTIPGPLDVATVVPPSLPAWRRRVGTTNRWLYFTVHENGSVKVMMVAGLV